MSFPIRSANTESNQLLLPQPQGPDLAQMTSPGFLGHDEFVGCSVAGTLPLSMGLAAPGVSMQALPHTSLALRAQYFSWARAGHIMGDV